MTAEFNPRAARKRFRAVGDEVARQFPGFRFVLLIETDKSPGISSNMLLPDAITVCRDAAEVLEVAAMKTEGNA